MTGLLGASAIMRLREIDDRHLFDDDPEWLDAAAYEFCGTEDQLVEHISEHLREYRLRTFHGTRTADAGTFHRQGIRLHNRQQLEAEVRRIVDSEKSLSWLRPILSEKFNETPHLVDEGRCYVVVDERVLVDECGHYLLGGSEFIQGVIGPDHARRVFRGSAPTVIEIDLRLSDVPPSQVNSFARALIGEWAKSHRRRRLEAGRLDFTFVLREPVPPEWVAGHYHPRVVRDPHLRRKAVTTAALDCLSCRA